MEESGQGLYKYILNTLNIVVHEDTMYTGHTYIYIYTDI